MFAVDLDPDRRYDTVGTLDIETTGFDGSTDELVAVGVGYYEAGRESAAVDVLTRAAISDERALVAAAYDWLNERTPDGLVTYNGGSFDLPFLADRLAALRGRVGATPDDRDEPALNCTDGHVDLYPPRKRIADRAGRKWPSLEESLAAYDLPVHATRWEGAELTNARFEEVLAPRYLDALARGDDATVDELEPTVVEYTGADVEANVALYEADAGRQYTPRYSF